MHHQETMQKLFYNSETIELTAAAKLKTEDRERERKIGELLN